MSATCIGKFWAVTSFFAALASCVGFYFPYWLEGSYVTSPDDITPLYFGTFRRCSYPRVMEGGEVEVVDECGRYNTFLDIPSLFWQISTIAVGTGACLSLLMSLTAVMSLCVRDIVTVQLARAAGVLQLTAGLLVGAGVAVYPYGWDNPEVEQACGHDSAPYKLGNCSLGWALYLSAVGGGLTMALSVLSCHSYQHKEAQNIIADEV